MKKKKSFSKRLLVMETAIVLYTTYQGIQLAHLAVEGNYAGSLAWLTAMVSAAWGAYGTSAAFYYNKAKAENTAGGLTYELACREAADGAAAPGQDCD